MRSKFVKQFSLLCNFINMVELKANKKLSGTCLYNKIYTGYRQHKTSYIVAALNKTIYNMT